MEACALHAEKQVMDQTVVQTIRDYFSTQPVLKAWVFGSFSRGEETSESDVDILVIFDRSLGPIGLMQHVRMMLDLEERLGRKVDLVEDGTLLPFAVESANRDKIMVYERA